MKKAFSIFALVFLLFGSTVSAQSCDPWIVSIYKSLYQRAPSDQECNIRNYNNGSWSSYQQLTDLIKNYQNSLKPTSTTSSANITGDPWITSIYKELYYRQPNSWEYNIKNYNNGSWGSYQQLKNYVIQFQKSLRDNGITIKTAIVNSENNLVVFQKNGVNIAVNLLSNKGGNVVAAGGLNVIAAGGGNVVAAGGANVVAAGGGNVIAAGGGNVIAAGGGNLTSGRYRVQNNGSPSFMVSSNLAGASFGSGYSVQSGNNVQITTSGNGTLVFK